MARPQGWLLLLVGVASPSAWAQTPAVRPAVLSPEALAQVPLASLPAAPPPIGLPQLQDQVSCPALQHRLRALLGGETGVWSVTVADPSGRLLADINGWIPRIPASNQTLISTAYALDRLGPD